MSFACQRNSYLQEYETSILSCELETLTLQNKQKLKGYNVIFEDTILFPEGGGQNDDRGIISRKIENGINDYSDEDIPVLRVVRNGDKAIHFLHTNTPLEKGCKVKQVVDWKRRFDHMQQHTGQHLISAMFEKHYNVDTSSWWMAENDNKKVGVSFIEMNTGSLTEKQLEHIEESCNKAIRDHLDVMVNVYEKDDPALVEAHTRGLPDDIAGPVRVIQIGSGKRLIDSNLCCGTHVSNLSHLQMVKLLNTEKAKKGKGNKCNVYFLVGDRVATYIQSTYLREQKMNTLLSSGPDDHLMIVEKINKSVKASLKSVQVLLKELAIKDAEEIKEKRLKYFSKHRSETDPEYANTLIREIENTNTTIFLTTGDEKIGPFQLTLYGPENIMKDISSQILTLLNAKGGGKGKRINAKFSLLKDRPAAETFLKEYFN